MQSIESISLDAIREAARRLKSSVVRTPLVPLNVEREHLEIFLKLENLQPIGSFKLRGAGNAMAAADPKRLKEGVYTASAGNMAQGVAWTARRLGIPCTVIVPDHAPLTKLEAITRLGAAIVKVSFDDWWEIIVNHGRPGMEGVFVHPVSDPAVIAGNGTIGLEILEDLPDACSVIVPYGGGGLSCGIASALRILKPEIKVLAAEVETAAPLAASLEAGSPQKVEYIPTFVDGIGSKSLLSEMWPLASRLLDGSVVVSPSEIAASIRLLALRNRVVAEGAGAAPVAAALKDTGLQGPVVCVVSGGNLDTGKLIAILQGSVP